ncbi:hypothetical protein IQ273_24225 [Nodosilinea sp. LEGE 07298]|jgi:hypothetical protein|uniref:hypothetical protein n=1 Tax=Nodosilinea sp. LEGE 07298 TaxID=2777970 RepID=UPI0018807FF5|nr:hypothetical protein [Nodosilinea sp. LEGE 07298]MBE9112504.1 hypothetical protein [Nodosilinea sp. LEGE 07298]
MHPDSLEDLAVDLPTDSPIDWDELFEYLPGTLVERVDQPGTLYAIEGYEATMVPPIWLVDDPRPRYPHELRIVSQQPAKVCTLAQPTPQARAAHPA